VCCHGSAVHSDISYHLTQIRPVEKKWNNCKRPNAHCLFKAVLCTVAVTHAASKCEIVHMQGNNSQQSFKLYRQQAVFSGSIAHDTCLLTAISHKDTTHRTTQPLKVPHTEAGQVLTYYMHLKCHLQWSAELVCQHPAKSCVYCEDSEWSYCSSLPATQRLVKWLVLGPCCCHSSAKQCNSQRAQLCCAFRYLCILAQPENLANTHVAPWSSG